MIISKNTKKILIGIALLAAYICLEPQLSQMYALHAYAMFEVPYRILKTAVPWVMIIGYIWHVIKEKGNVQYGALLPIAVLSLCYLIPTAMAGQYVYVWYETVVPLFGYYLFILFMSRNKESFHVFLRLSSDLYLLLAVVNFTFLIYPDLFAVVGSWTPEAFLTTIENQVGFPLVMGLFFCLLDNHYNGRKAILYIYMFVYLISTLLMWTAAQVIGAIVVVIYMLPPIRRFFEETNVFMWFMISLLLFIVLVFFWEPLKNMGVIRFLLEDVLKKDVTFTGRLHIWDGVWQLTKEKLILGHGLLENPQMIFYDDGFNNNFVHAHNGFLQTWYEAGIFGIIAVSFLFFYTGRKCKLCKNRTVVGIVNLILFVYLINFEMDEFFIFPWRTCMWCMMSFICHFAVTMADDSN